MTDRTVYKNLAGLEDLQFGRGTINQARNGGTYPITKISTPIVVTSTAARDALDPELFPMVGVIESGTDFTLYEYDSGTTSWVAVTLQNQRARDFASFYLTGELTTSIISPGVATRVEGTTAAAADNNGFSHVSGRLTATFTGTKLMTVHAAVQVKESNLANLDFYIAINGTERVDTKHRVPAATATCPRLASWSSTLEISSNDQIEVYVANADDITNVVAAAYNVTVRD